MALGRCLAVAVIVGTVLAAETDVAATDAVAAAFAAASLSIVCRQRAPRRALLLVAALGAAAGHTARARDAVLDASLDRWVDRRPAVVPGAGVGPAPELVQGILVEDALPGQSGARLLIDVEGVRESTGWHEVRGRVQAHIAGTLAGPLIEQWSAGRRVQAPIALRRLQVWRNPGAPDPRRQALSRRFTLTGTIKSATLVEVTLAPWWDEAAARVRAYVRRQVNRYLAPIDPRSAAVVTAILIGDRAGLGDETVRRLQAAGTYHVIAISGGNVALVALICLGTVRMLVRPFRAATIATMALVAVYGWVVGGDPSVSRAVAAACTYLACRAVGLAPSPLDVLGVVALLVVAADPLTVLDVGAWLSFAATCGIILGAGRLAAWLGAGRSRLRSWPQRVWEAALALLSATLCAELTLLPVSASVFWRVGLAGLLLNFIAIPAMAVVQVAGTLMVILGAGSDAAARPVAGVAHLAVRALVDSAALLDLAPWLSWRVPPPAMLWGIAFYAGGALAIGASRRWARLRVAAALVATLSAGVIVTGSGTGAEAPRPGWLRVTMLDVGQGESILVQFPTGQSLLIDAGGVPGGFDVGGRVVTPALWALGVRRLDWLAFTHADLDHIDGAIAVVEVLRPREVWEGTPVPRDARRQALRDLATRQGAAWRQLQRGDVFQLGGIEIGVRHPPLPEWERQRVRNDDSLVLEVRYGHVDLLLTGDISRTSEAELRVAPDERSALRVLKVAHHGSRTSTSAEFVEAEPPHLALISAGRNNPFGHPAPDVVGRLRAAGAAIFRTDLDGAVCLESDGDHVEVATFSGRRRGFSLFPAAAAAAGGREGGS